MAGVMNERRLLLAALSALTLGCLTDLDLGDSTSSGGAAATTTSAGGSSTGTPVDDASSTRGAADTSSTGSPLPPQDSDGGASTDTGPMVEECAAPDGSGTVTFQELGVGQFPEDIDHDEACTVLAQAPEKLGGYRYLLQCDSPEDGLHTHEFIFTAPEGPQWPLDMIPLQMRYVRIQPFDTGPEYYLTIRDPSDSLLLSYYAPTSSAIRVDVASFYAPLSVTLETEPVCAPEPFTPVECGFVCPRCQYQQERTALAMALGQDTTVLLDGDYGLLGDRFVAVPWARRAESVPRYCEGNRLELSRFVFFTR